MAAAKLSLAPDDALNENFLLRLRHKAGDALKRALSKVLGVIDIKARLVYVDRAVIIVRQTFLKLHEIGHACLPWQRGLYAVVEDCEKTISPEISERFDQEANAFASEVLFQLDTFTNEAADHPLSLKTPLKLSKKYGASIYSTIRRYVSTNHRVCMVLVLDPPEFKSVHGFTCTLRRVLASPSFDRTIGRVRWPERFTPDDDIGAFVPIGGRRMSYPRPLRIVNCRGESHDCVAEAFTQTHQIFILVHSIVPTTVVVLGNT
ncbi:MAG TPA: ImmA/IrrE family metallo-endopeptidase [Candidatus Saccharimonadales bacterium]|jgi:hypothetical protein|nr:ImmA/IrrE family metallo-endopeptidase [Candidatus Saccharimonadales bacterium]